MQDAFDVGHFLEFFSEILSVRFSFWTTIYSGPDLLYDYSDHNLLVCTA